MPAIYLFLILMVSALPDAKADLTTSWPILR